VALTFESKVKILLFVQYNFPEDNLYIKSLSTCNLVPTCIRTRRSVAYQYQVTVTLIFMALYDCTTSVCVSEHLNVSFGTNYYIQLPYPLMTETGRGNG